MHNHHVNTDQMMEQMALEQNVKRFKHTILVLSGKGGVGKSTVSANLAMSLASSGHTVGLLDVDFHGPSIPKMMGLEHSRPEMVGDKLIPLTVGENLKVMSLGFLVDTEDAVIWRGPMKMGALQQLLRDVEWGELDYMIFDCPPGTGDEPLSIVQLIPNATGAVVVTTPQDVSTSDVVRSLKFCEKVNLPVLGVVENMSGYTDPETGKTLNLFGFGGGEKMAKAHGVPFLGRIPIEPQIVEACDAGQPFVYHYGQSATARNFENVAERTLDQVTFMDAAKEKARSARAEKPANIRRYAVPVENGVLTDHFGHAESFAILDYDMETGTIVKMTNKRPPSEGNGAYSQFLEEQATDIVIARGIGGGTRDNLSGRGIELIMGAEIAKPSELVKAHVAGTLNGGASTCNCSCNH